MRQFRRFAALLLAGLLLSGQVLPALASTPDLVIDSREDFLAFAENCTSDTWSQGLTVSLTAGIDLSGSGFTSIPIFQGTFHGNGHTIQGFSLTGKGSRIGLFRTLTETAVVDNLTVEGAVAPGGTAGQVGLLAGENYGTIQNCTAKGAATGVQDVGGIAGLNGESGTIEGCSSTATISGTTNAGGITGQNLGAIRSCTNSGEVDTAADQEPPTSVGGIAGLSRGTIQSCRNSGAVGYAHLGYNMGGIVGLQSGSVLDCVNTGAVKGRKDVGGIVGQFEPNTQLTYGPSPMDRLNDALAVLFDQMSVFVDQVNDITARGVADAQVIEDAMGQIQDRTHDAGTEGHQDFQTMSDQLYGYTQDISDALDRLHQNTDAFQSTADDDLDALLKETDNFRTALDDMLSSADSGLSQAIEALDDTASDIHRQGMTIQNALAQMNQEMKDLHAYLEEVAQLVASGDYIGALELPFPSLDPRGHLTDIGDATASIFRLANDLTGQWKDISDETSSDLDKAKTQADKAADALYDAADHLLGAADRFSGQVSSDVDAVDTTGDLIRDLLKDYTDTLGDKAQSAADDIDAQLTIIRDQVDQMTQAAGTDNDALHTTADQIIGSLDQVRQAIYDLGQKPELTISDLAEEVTEGPGLVRGCTVSATVEGDSNTGGIAGTVSTELGSDPEETFSLEDMELLTDVYATLRAVIRDCRFDGSVTVMNDCAGGIAGRCEAGAILDCAARGTVETGTGYCGGIAGRTQGAVTRCAALVDLTGGSWLGGITGLGGDLTDCRAMVRCDSDGEALGAITGERDGDLSGNRYLREDLPGLDGVDVAGEAQGLDFDAFSQLDYIPADFLTFSYRFVVDGQTVAELPFSYGDDLDLSLVPQAPEKDGQFGVWPDYPTQDLHRSMVLEASFSAPVTTLASGESIPVLLVQGTFSPDATLTVETMDLPDNGPSGYTPAAAYSYTVTGCESDTVTLRLRAQDVDRPAAAVLVDGVWRLAETQTDGSYLVLEGPAEGQVLLLDHTSPGAQGWVLAICVGAAALLLLLLLGFHWRRRTKKEAVPQG